MAMLVITRGYIPLNPIKPPFSYGFPMVNRHVSKRYHYSGVLPAGIPRMPRFQVENIHSPHYDVDGNPNFYWFEACKKDEDVEATNKLIAGDWNHVFFTFHV